MLNILKTIPLIDNIREDKNHGWLMSVGSYEARCDIFPGSLTMGLFIGELKNITLPNLRYVSLLLAAHPDIHDYALQMDINGGWLYCFYDKSLSPQILSIEIEKHLALACYLRTKYFNTKS